MEIEVACPFPGCDHISRHDDAAIVVELLKIHGLTHSAAATPGGNMNKLKRPTVSLAGTSELYLVILRNQVERIPRRHTPPGRRHRCPAFGVL